MIFSGYLISWLGWSSVFYFTGGMTLLWGIFWMVLVYDSPEEHPWISEAEKTYIILSIGTDKSEVNNLRFASF